MGVHAKGQPGAPIINKRARGALSIDDGIAERSSPDAEVGRTSRGHSFCI
jgi:hypothetical protein